MPTYEIKAPNGKTYRIDGPSGASQEDVQNAVLGQHPEAAYERYRDYQRASNPGEYDSSSPEFRQKFGAQSGSTLQNLRAGVGKGFTDILRGLGQFAQEAPFGLPGPGGAMLNMAGDLSPRMTERDVAETRARDADLMSTKAGKAGMIGGTIVGLAPLALVPGANTYAGAAAIGGVSGAVQPHASPSEQMTNTAIGGLASPAALAIGRGVTGLAKGAKAAFIDPFTKAGQERIAANTFQSFAGGADEAAKAAQAIRSNAGSVLPGIKPTTAELADNAGLNNLERLLKNNPEFVQQFSNRALGNRNVMLSALDDIAGDDALRAAAVTARESAARPLYAAADSAIVQADDTLASLLKRPSMASAWRKAANIAAEAGEEISPETLSGRTLHFLKTAMDDLSDWSPGSAIGKSEAAAIGKTRDALVSWMDTNVPSYGAAREAFKAGSKPINQMDIGAALRDKLTPALSDFGAQGRLRPESFAQALRAGDATAAKVLDRSKASITDILSPDQMGTLNKIGQQLARRANVDDVGRAVGSNTGQNLIGQNVIRQMLGPLGLPDSMIARATQGPLLKGLLGSPATIAGKATETVGQTSILQKLVELGLSPEEALKVLEAQIAQQSKLGVGRYIAPAVSGANAAIQ